MIDLKAVRRFIKNIRSGNLYSTQEILALDSVSKTKLFGRSGVFTLYRLIKSGQLKAVNVSTRKGKPIYAVKGYSLKRFISQRFKEVL